MKSLTAAFFAALLLAGAAAAEAAGPGTPVTPGATATETVSAPSASANHGSEALPVFNYQGAVPLTSSIGPGRTTSIAPWNASADLVNQTGGER